MAESLPTSLFEISFCWPNNPYKKRDVTFSLNRYIRARAALPLTGGISRGGKKFTDVSP
jgi:hypothetical protein